MNPLVRIILFVADCLGLNALFRRLNARRVAILMYHGVTERNLPGRIWTVISSADFGRQMRYLKRYFSVVSASSLLSDHDDRRNRVVITFDDGLENTLVEAEPILRRYGLPAICFVLPELSASRTMIWADDILSRLAGSPLADLDLAAYGLGTIELGTNRQERIDRINDLIDKMKTLPHDRRCDICDAIRRMVPAPSSDDADVFELMTIAQIRQLANDTSFEIGPHSNTHPILSTMSRTAQEQEIVGCLEALRENDIPFVPIFAYPNGGRDDFDTDTREILWSCGIHLALTTVDGLFDEADDPMAAKRVAIGPDCGIYEFKARLSGLFYFLQRLKRR